MKLGTRAGFLALALLTVFPAAAQARILVHLAPSSTPMPCNLRLDPPSCSEIVTAGGLLPNGYFAYVLVNNTNVAGVQFGIAYDGVPASGVDVYAWTHCASLQFPEATWPESGSGILVTWDPQNNCQTSGMAVAGYFYVGAYNPDVFRITPRPVDGLAKVASCTAFESVVPETHLGVARFTVDGNLNGFSPCVDPPASSCISGPDVVIQGAVNTYQANTSATAPTFAWSLIGNGTITSPTDGASVQVQAGNTGSYTLSLTTTPFGGSPRTCHFEVDVVPQPNGGTQTILLHVTPQTGQPCLADPPACSQVNTRGAFPGEYYAWVLATSYEGIGGLQFGVQYDPAPGAGLDVLYWTPCGDLEFNSPGWPNSGTGNLVTWQGCQLQQPGGPGGGVVTLAGYFHVSTYGADILKIIPRPVDGVAKIANCVAAESIVPPHRLGTAAFSQGGNVYGFNPCGLFTPVRPTTWSGIKTLETRD
jgi:hypothetical protein